MSLIMENEKKHYEIGFLLKSEEKKSEIKKILENQKVEITEEGAIVGIKLAYPIEKENFAHFGYIRFIGEPSAIKEIDYDAKNSADILRHLITVYPAEKIAKAKKERRSLGLKETSARQTQAAKAVTPPVFKRAKKAETLTNEDLEKRLEEILE
jgi:ribosomal protein S6